MLLGRHQVKSPTGVNWKKDDKLAVWKQIVATIEKLVNLLGGAGTEGEGIEGSGNKKWATRRGTDG